MEVRWEEEKARKKERGSKVDILSVLLLIQVRKWEEKGKE